MGDFAAEPPQGHEDSQQILVENRTHPHIRSPQGLQSEEVGQFGPVMLYEDSVRMDYENLSDMRYEG